MIRYDAIYQHSSKTLDIIKVMIAECPHFQFVFFFFLLLAYAASVAVQQVKAGRYTENV